MVTEGKHLYQNDDEVDVEKNSSILLDTWPAHYVS